MVPNKPEAHHHTPKEERDKGSARAGAPTERDTGIDFGRERVNTHSPSMVLTRIRVIWISLSSNRSLGLFSGELVAGRRTPRYLSAGSGRTRGVSGGGGPPAGLHRLVFGD